MLRSLNISNVVLIDRLDIDFNAGFGVLTGETGAGKSIIIDAVNLLLGARGGKSLVRHGEDKASVQGLFSASGEVNTILEENGIDLKKGLFELFGFLREKGIKIAVATATPRERTLKYLEKIQILSYIDAIVCGDMVTTGKPAPDIYLTAAKELGLPPEEGAAFEDSPNGIKSAYSAGCHAVMIPDMTPPDEEIMPMLSGVYDNLEDAVEFFTGRI